MLGFAPLADLPLAATPETEGSGIIAYPISGETSITASPIAGEAGIIANPIRP